MLLYFILGILFIFVIIPILENLLSIFNAFTEYLVYLFAIKIYKIKKQIGIQEDEKEKDSHFPLGFQHTQAIGEEIIFDDQEDDQ